MHGPPGTQGYKVYINDDPGLILIYFTTRSSLVKFAYCALINQTNNMALKLLLLCIE